MTTPLKISLGFSASFFILLVGLLLRHCIAIKIISYLKRMKDYLANAQLEKQLVRENGSVKLATRKFTAKELDEATSNFDDEKIIGTGEHGKVYKGILPDGRVVAIKKFESEESTVRSKFVKDVNVLSRISHRNVVRLLGYCIDSRQQTLVYDFINHGTLYERIHGKDGQGSDPSSTLTLELRIKIAAETAAALAYMHSSSTSRSSIIHLNVNSKRILLDENYTAKLAYFREAKLVPDDQTQIEGSVRGCAGYLDPEELNVLSEKDDVYSFGVVLAELLTSLKAHSPEKPEGERNLANVFCSMEEGGRLDQILDGEVIKEEHFKMAKQVAALARSCLGPRNGRPSMKDVATKLEVLRFMTWHYSATAKGTMMANLNVSRAPKEIDDHRLLGSPSKAQVIDIRVDYGDFGSTGFITGAELFDRLQHAKPKPILNSREPGPVLRGLLE